MDSTAVANRVSGDVQIPSPKNPFTQTNGSSLPLGLNRRPKSCRSPRPPPLISKFHGEPLTSAEGRSKPALRGINKKNIMFSPCGLTSSSRSPYYIIHPEWSSESKGISKLNTMSSSPLPICDTKVQVKRSAHRRHQVATPVNGDDLHGILPADKGPEGVLAVARRAAVCNPVWPHRCKSAPAQRSTNPITWE